MSVCVGGGGSGKMCVLTKSYLLCSRNECIKLMWRFTVKPLRSGHLLMQPPHYYSHLLRSLVIQ